MKQAVLYYSIGGHCAKIATSIAEKTGAELIEILPVRKWTGWMAYPICGFQATSGRRVKLRKINADLRSFDHLTIVSPIHASRVAAAVRSFLFENRSHYSNVKLVLCHGDQTNTYESAKIRLEKELMFTFSEFESFAD